MQQLLSGDIDSLWTEFEADTSKRPTRPPRRSAEEQQQANARRALTLASEGDLSRATSALTSLGMADPGKSFQALLAKHPPGSPTSTPVNHTPALQISQTQVSAAIQSFSKSAGPGPSGERPAHLQYAIQGPNSAAAQRALKSTTAVVNQLLAGKAPKTVMEWLSL